MFAWLFRLVLRRNIRRVNEGDYKPMLDGYAKDAVLIFPGENSWAGEHRGRDAIEKFLQRFVRVGIQFEAHEILVHGWPWSARICVRFSDSARAPDGALIYENSGVIYVKTSWGKITLQEDFEDTEKVAALDVYLAAHLEQERSAAGKKAS
jgi:ketosteroid isomerase-like protein